MPIFSSNVDFNVLESVKPDIVFGTATWLYSHIKDPDIFPKGYKVYRKDRAASDGGVLVAFKDEFDGEYVLELDADCELIWAKVKLIGSGTLYVCFYYRNHV